MSTQILTRWFLLVLVAGIVLSGCKKDAYSVYDPNYDRGTQPTVAAISPADSAQAGVDTLTIAGTGFSPTSGATLVYFNSTAASLLSVTPTAIQLKAPFVLGDSVGVRVAVMNVDAMSPVVKYKLQAAVVTFGTLTAGQQLANAMTTDAAGNLYVGLTNANNSDIGIFRITPAGDRTAYTTAAAGVGAWSGMKFGPGGYLYVTRNTRAIFRFNPGGAGTATIFGPQVTGSFMLDFDFDQNQNMWIGGNNSSLYRIKQDRTLRAFPFVGNVHSVRVFQNSLYVSALVSGSEGIWRFPIAADTLGTPVLHFNFAAAMGSEYIPQGITFSAGGTMYIATNGPAGVVVVEPSGAFLTPFSAYSGLYAQPVKWFAWGAETDFYASTSGGVLLKVAARTAGAAYLGR